MDRTMELKEGMDQRESPSSSPRMIVGFGQQEGAAQSNVGKTFLREQRGWEVFSFVRRRSEETRTLSKKNREEEEEEDFQVTSSSTRESISEAFRLNEQNLQLQIYLRRSAARAREIDRVYRSSRTSLPLSLERLPHQIPAPRLPELRNLLRYIALPLCVRHDPLSLLQSVPLSSTSLPLRRTRRPVTTFRTTLSYPSRYRKIRTSLPLSTLATEIPTVRRSTRLSPRQHQVSVSEVSIVLTSLPLLPRYAVPAVSSNLTKLRTSLNEVISIGNRQPKRPLFAPNPTT
jgi:hypothetical protein